MRTLTSCYIHFNYDPPRPIISGWTACDEIRKAVAMTFWKDEFEDPTTMMAYKNNRRYLPNGDEVPHGLGYRNRLKHLEFAKKHDLPVDVILLTPTDQGHKVKERETVDWKMCVEYVYPNGDFRLFRAQET
jgi:hypothetical protein